MRFQSADEFRIALQGGTVEVTAPEPSNPRKTWFAGFHGMLPGVPPRFADVHISRRAAMMALAPAVLAAGLFAVRLTPTLRRAPAIPAYAGGPEIARTPTEQPAAAVPPPVPEAPSVAATQPVESPAPEAPISNVSLRPKPTAKTLRRATQTQPDTSLRITGGESHPMAAMPAPRRETGPILDTPEPVSRGTTSVEPPAAPAPEMALQDTAASPPEAAVASQAASQANPPATGNRFVRALGKVNPFRKLKKNDAVKEQLKKD